MRETNESAAAERRQLQTGIAAAIFGIVRFQHHGDMGVGGAHIGAQAAAHLQTGKFGQHPIDKGPHRPFDEARRTIRPQPVEGEAAMVVNEVLKAGTEVAGHEDIDDIH